MNWDNATFSHATTGFALVGLHSTQQCAACHANNNYSLASTACWNCHQTDYNGTTNPPHLAGGFPQDCVPCHGASALSWTTATFDHATTGFTLVGQHATQQCAACHVNNNYNLTSAACTNCHLTDYNGANNPPHAASGFPQDCTLCHGSSALNWTSATFNHATTGFTLTGAHTSLAMRCNATSNNNYSLTSGACWNCHQADYNSTNNPPHKSANFPQDCSLCHTTTELGRRHVQPRHHRLRAGGAARHPAVRGMPRQQQLQPDQRGLHQLPSDRLQRHNQPAARIRRVPAGLHPVPWNIDAQLDERDVQPCHYGLHAHRRAHQPPVRPVPREQQLQPDQRRLLELPPDRLQRHHQPERTSPPTSRRIAPAATPPPIGRAPPSTMPPPASPWWAYTPPSSARHATSTATTA